MKTTKTTCLKLLLLWATLAGVFPAQAYYDPGAQRWLNRDPLGELGFENIQHDFPNAFGDGSNLYAFVSNDPVSRTDSFGLMPVCTALALIIGSANALQNMQLAVAAQLIYNAICGPPPNPPDPPIPYYPDFPKCNPNNRGYRYTSPFPSFQRGSIFANPGVTYGSALAVGTVVVTGAVIATKGRILRR